MEVKTIKIRDAMTEIDVMAVKPVPRNEKERAAWSRNGYGANPSSYTFVAKIAGGEQTGHWDAYDWGVGGTMFHAHQMIASAWSELLAYDEINVQALREGRA